VAATATWKEVEKDDERATGAPETESATERLAVQAADGPEPLPTGQLRRHLHRPRQPPRRQLQRHDARWLGGGSPAAEAVGTAAA
jgi:hypothetical protein